MGPESAGKPESRIQSEIQSALGRLPDVCLWRNHTGAVKDERGRWHTFGLAVGSADLVGVLTVGGRGIALFIEVKSATGRLSPEQIAFRSVVTRFGAIHVLARGVEDALAAIEKARSDYA